jgi:6-phosphogluconolactonase
MLDHVLLVPIQVHPMVPVGCEPRVSDRSPWHELEDVAEAARAYEATLLRELEVPGVPNQSLAGASCRPPRLDLVLLGLGDDGHTASLFPGSTAVEEQHRWVVATPAPGGAEERELARLTLTLPVLNAAREAIFLVSGAAKSATVAAVLREGGGSSSASSPQPLPAARVLPARGQLTWLLDAGAASELSPGA